MFVVVREPAGSLAAYCWQYSRRLLARERLGIAVPPGSGLRPHAGERKGDCTPERPSAQGRKGKRSECGCLYAVGRSVESRTRRGHLKTEMSIEAGQAE
jgi:hypothetical protein